jgi:hypothetical protein
MRKPESVGLGVRRVRGQGLRAVSKEMSGK